MKKFITIASIVAASILMLVSCYPAAKYVVGYIDYGKYYEDGFLLTPDSYYGEYTPCGEISIEITPAYPENTMEYWMSEGSIKYQNPDTGVWRTKKLKEESKLDEVIEIAVNEAKARGADAITNFRTEVSFFQNSMGVDARIESFSLSGFCIKRNDK